MAKKTDQGMGNLFKKTTAQESTQAEKSELKGTNISVYLSGDNRAAFEAIAEELGCSVHYLLQTAAKQFLERYAAGEISTKTETVTLIE